jgi:hypothetical protein
MPFVKQYPYVQMFLEGAEDRDISLDEAGLFLFDFASLYELTRLALDPKYQSFRFSSYAASRRTLPIVPEDKMYVEKLRHESPFETQLAIAIAAGITAVSSFTTMVLLVSNQRWNRMKQRQDLEIGELDKQERRLKIQKLENELADASNDGRIITLEEANEVFALRGAAEAIGTVTRRLEKSPIQIKTFDVNVINPNQQNQSKDGTLADRIEQGNEDVE